jgi:two-component system, NarL family, invasion response regulator UvrY
MLQELACTQHTLPIKVMLVDDHPAVRFGIRNLIADAPDLALIIEHGSASADTVNVARWADVAVIDYHLGDRDGLWLAQQIKRGSVNGPPVLIYSAFADAQLAAAAIVAGADGLLSKTTLAEELSVAIRRLAEGRQYFPAIPPPLAAALCARLEPTEQAICSMLIQGVSPAEIGVRLNLSPGELSERRASILEAIAPRTERARVVDAARAPLDYERPSRRRRYPART